MMPLTKKVRTAVSVYGMIFNDDVKPIFPAKFDLNIKIGDSCTSGVLA